MPSEFILSKYLNVNISACEENGNIGATFHGLLGPQDLKRKGNKLLFVFTICIWLPNLKLGNLKKQTFLGYTCY